MMKNQLRVGVVLSYFNMFIGSLIPMFYTPIMLQLLGQDEYGLYRLASSVTSYLSLISFGIGSAVVRYFSKYLAENDKDGEERIFGLFNVIFGIISIITIIVGVIITLNLGFIYGESLGSSYKLFKMQILVVILTINTALTFFSSPYNAVVACHERFLFLQIINIILTVITPVINIVFLFLGYKSIGLACSTLALNIIVRIVYVYYVRRTLKIRPRYNNMPKYLIKEILIFSFWVFVANVVNQLHAATDTAIIGAIPFLSTIGVAVYNIGATFNTMMNNFSTGLLSLLTPKVNKLVFKNTSMKELTDLMIRVGRLQCYIVSLFCSGFISFGAPFIYLWAGKDYSEAYWVALFTMIPACIPLVQNVAYNIIVAMNKHRFRSLTYLFVAIANVILTIPATLYLGVVGASLMTGICAIFGSLISMNWYYWKKIKLDIPRFWKEVAPIYIIPSVLCIITIIVSFFINMNSWIALFVGVIVYIVLFIVLSWIFVMNKYEKDIFKAPLRIISNLRNKREKNRNNQSA